jgi:hypothetical protein
LPKDGQQLTRTGNGPFAATSKGKADSAPQANKAQHFLCELSISSVKQKPKGSKEERWNKGRNAAEESRDLMV